MINSSSGSNLTNESTIDLALLNDNDRENDGNDYVRVLIFVSIIGLICMVTWILVLVTN